MANTVATIWANNTSTTKTMTSADYVNAQQFVMQIAKNGGVFDDVGTWYPVSAIQKVTIA